VKSDDILGPIKTQFGYHVIKFDARRASLKDRLDELATSLAAAGVDFTEAATTATNTIEELTFASPGYVPKYTVNPELGAVVWGLKAGGTSAVVESSNTYLIVHVDGVEMRELTADQIAGIKGSGFSIWLDLYRSAARVAIDGAVVQEAGASPIP
jgi:parvulin-like peptidyl-prolyl isomerase